MEKVTKKYKFTSHRCSGASLDIPFSVSAEETGALFFGKSRPLVLVVGTCLLSTIVQQLSKKEKLKRVHRYSSIVLTSQHGVLDGGCNVETETLFTVLSPLWSL